MMAARPSDFVSRPHAFAFALVCVVAFSCASRRVAAQPMCFTERPVVQKINKLYQENFGFGGLVHVTLSGAVHHGNKGVEVWLQTFAPGYATNVRSQEQDTVVVVLRGEGALRFRPNHTDHVSPAPFESTPFRANSTVIIPRNTVHQLVNSSKKRLQFLHIFGKPPIRFREFASWEEAQGKKVFPGPFDRKCLPGSFFGGHRASPSQDM